jgi:thiol-disulfide isomerase/thioredoxin
MLRLLRIELWIILFFTITVNNFNAETITGKLSSYKNQSIKLQGFNGFNSFLISENVADYQGYFKLTYPESNYGIGFLISSDNNPFLVLLNGEEIEIIGKSLSPEEVKITKGKENQLFERYAKDNHEREKVLTAWDYLKKIYTEDSVFSNHRRAIVSIQREKKRIEKDEQNFLESLPESSYLKWHIPKRKLISSVVKIAQYNQVEIGSTISKFRELDYSDDRLFKSGLLKDAVDGHFWLIENSGLSLDSIFQVMKISIDSMMIYLVKNEKRLDEVTNYLFDLLERHSLFKASEYLALRVLNEFSCTINVNLARQLETYRAMKKGNIAPDILFLSELLGGPIGIVPSNLSDLKSPYTVVVFGASWCDKCRTEIPKIRNLYGKWNTHGIQVVFISLDESQADFKAFAKEFPFLSYCDSLVSDKTF